MPVHPSFQSQNRRDRPFTTINTEEEEEELAEEKAKQADDPRRTTTDPIRSHSMTKKRAKSNADIRDKEISARIEKVKNMLFTLIPYYVTKEEAVEWVYGVDPSLVPIYTENVWECIAAENKDFFEDYVIRVKLRKQIEMFNGCLKKTWETMHPDVASSASINNNGYQTSYATSQAPNNMRGNTNHPNAMMSRYNLESQGQTSYTTGRAPHHTIGNPNHPNATMSRYNSETQGQTSYATGQAPNNMRGNTNHPNAMMSRYNLETQGQTSYTMGQAPHNMSGNPNHLNTMMSRYNSETQGQTSYATGQVPNNMRGNTNHPNAMMNRYNLETQSQTSYTTGQAPYNMIGNPNHSNAMTSRYNSETPGQAPINMSGNPNPGNAMMSRDQTSYATGRAPNNVNGNTNHLYAMMSRYNSETQDNCIVDNSLSHYPHSEIQGVGNTSFYFGDQHQDYAPHQFGIPDVGTFYAPNLASQNFGSVGTSSLCTMHGEQIDLKAFGLPDYIPNASEKAHDASFADVMLPQLEPIREDQPYFSVSNQTYLEILEQMNDYSDPPATNFNDTQGGGFHHT